MDAVSKVNMRNKVAAVVAVTVVVLAVVATARPVKLHKASSTCTTEDTYVYPYWSLCASPAELSVGYHLVSLSLGGLEPEYDETNSTYYVRFTGSFSDFGSTYVAVGATSTNGTLLVGSTVYIVNSESQRALQWRQEGTDEYFLIEQSVTSLTEGALFRFVQAEGVALPCPLIYPPAMCQAYYLVSNPSTSTSDAASGLMAYEENAATYVKAAAAGSNGDLPIVVIRASSSTSRSGLPFPTIRTVTQ